MTELVDLTEVLDDDLDDMQMPALQQRRFRANAAAIPHVVGGGTSRMQAVDP